MELFNDHKNQFSNPYSIATWCCRPLIFQTMSYVGPNSLSLKYQSFTPSGRKDIGIIKKDLWSLHNFLVKLLWMLNEQTFNTLPLDWIFVLLSCYRMDSRRIQLDCLDSLVGREGSSSWGQGEQEQGQRRLSQQQKWFQLPQ